MVYENKEFYPTPVGLIKKMFEGIKLYELNNILEPSAGKGDIVDYIKNISAKNYKIDIDTVELEKNLVYILKGKGYKVIHDNFLTLNTYKAYSLIIMNPPFSNGDKHLLKALEMQKLGGKVVCILNAETLKNPCTNIRKDLVKRLEELGAKVEYLKNEFTIAERKTNVEIALIKVDIPNKSSESIILENLKKEKINYGEYETSNDLVDGDIFKGIVAQYEFEIKAGVKLINESYLLRTKLVREFDKPEDSILNIVVSGNSWCSSRHSCINQFIKQVRYKYWKTFFNTNNIRKLLTHNLLQNYMCKLDKLMDYDFSLYNIYEIRESINKEMAIGVEECILNLFDELSYQYSYNEEYSKNIHYYNGWKSNKAWLINKKVIIPLNVYSTYSNKYEPCYNAILKLGDIEKALNYLSCGKSSNHKQEYDLRKQLEIAEKENQTKKIPLRYFTVTFYKKGTCHIEFTDLELLKKLNIFGSQQKKWLPPSYGESNYEDMTCEEQEVINHFEGKEEYKKTMSNKEYFIYKSTGILQLQG